MRKTFEEQLNTYIEKLHGDSGSKWSREDTESAIAQWKAWRLDLCEQALLLALDELNKVAEFPLNPYNKEDLALGCAIEAVKKALGTNAKDV